MLVLPRMSQKEKNTGKPVPSAYLIHASDDEALQGAKNYAENHGIDLQLISIETFLGDAAPEQREMAATRWILQANDDQLPELFERAIAAEASLGFIVNKTSVLNRLFSLPRALGQQIELAFSLDPVAVDITRCNKELVIAIAAIGDIPFLDHRGQAFIRGQSSGWQRMALALGLFWKTARSLFRIRPSSVQLQIGDEERARHSAVTGIVVLENDADKLSNALLGERMSACDARLSAMLIAPTSVVAYLFVLLRAIFGGSALPRAISFIKTRRLIISSEQPLPYRIDGRKRSAERIEFEVFAKALQIKPGAGFEENNPVGTDERDSLRLRTLPENEQRLKVISGGLPLFTRVLEEDFADLFQMLRDNARVTADYVILTVASALLASLGLVLGSAAIIIGAMILAPLMAPIISLSMGVLRRDSSLMLASAKTIAIGVVLALAISALLAAMMPVTQITSEIQARLHPAIFDLAVAVVSGVAAAYAYTREHVMKSLPGVAIAVALVPPLAVAGIGIGWADLGIFGGAMLLFLTNLVGIAAAAALTFMILGYAPVKTAVRGLRILALAVALMSVPLYFSFNQIVLISEIEIALRAAPVKIGVQEYFLQEPQVILEGDHLVVRAVVLSPEWLSESDVDAIKAVLEKRLERPLELQLDVRLRR